MSWLRIDDKFVRHPKIAPLTDKAFRIHVEALCHAAEFLTDGRIPRTYIRPSARTRELEEAGLWHKDGDGWTVHDWLDYNPTKAEVEDQRSRRAAGNSSGGSKAMHYRWHVNRGVINPDCRWCRPP